MTLLLDDRPDDAVLRLRLNRPDKRNALSGALRDAIREALAAAAADQSVQVVILGAVGEVFCAGFDIGEFQGGDSAAVFAGAAGYHRAVHTFGKPLVAAVRGPALAGGMDLALMCDLRIASSLAAFGQPQVRMGLPAAFDLVRSVVAEGVARDLCLSGRRMEAEEALGCHLVQQLVAPEVLEESALAAAREIAASGSATALKAAILEAQPSLF